MQVLTRRLNEVGKIRIGCQVPIKEGKNAGKPRPERLKHFRLTSNSFSALQLASGRYGGTVQPWKIPVEWKDLPQMRIPDHQFELYTTSDALDILIRGDSLMDTLFEQWDGAYCVRRCDGEYILHDGYGKLTGMECQCPNNPEQRKALAVEGKACLAVSRLCVLLEGMPVGQWRLDTRGDNTPAEVRGLQDMLAGCQVERAMLKATMRLEFRTSRVMRGGKKEVHHYSCVVIEPRYTTEELLLAGERQARQLLRQSDETQKQLAEHIADLSGDHDAVAAELQRQRHGQPEHHQGAIQETPGATQETQPLQQNAPPPESFLAPQTATPAGTLGGTYVAQIEAVLAKAGMEPTVWFEWMERQLKKPQAQWTEGEYKGALARAGLALPGKKPAGRAPRTTAENDSKPAAVIANNDVELSHLGGEKLAGGFADWRWVLADHIEALPKGDLRVACGEALEAGPTFSRSVGEQLASAVLDTIQAQEDEEARNLHERLNAPDEPQEALG